MSSTKQTTIQLPTGEPLSRPDSSRTVIGGGKLGARPSSSYCVSKINTALVNSFIKAAKGNKIGRDADHIYHFMKLYDLLAILATKEWYHFIYSKKKMFFEIYYIFEKVDRNKFQFKLRSALLKAIFYLCDYLEYHNPDYAIMSFEQVKVPDNNFRIYLEYLLKSYYHMILCAVMIKKGGFKTEKDINLRLAKKFYNDVIGTSKIPGNLSLVR